MKPTLEGAVGFADDEGDDSRTKYHMCNMLCAHTNCQAFEMDRKKKQPVVSKKRSNGT